MLTPNTVGHNVISDRLSSNARHIVACSFWAARRADSRRILHCSATASSSDISPVGGGSGGNSGLIPGAVSNAEPCSSLSGGIKGRRRSRHAGARAHRRGQLVAVVNDLGVDHKIVVRRRQRVGIRQGVVNSANRFAMLSARTALDWAVAIPKPVPVVTRPLRLRCPFSELNPARAKASRIACSATGSATLPPSANESKR